MLLAPLGLAALAAIPVLVLFYLLKVRYRDHEVGSIYLWEQLVRDLAVHEPWQRPRFSPLLLIQALILAGLALALARPALLTGAADRVHAIVVLDGSASMGATDVPPTRFERARELARADVAALPDGSTGTVVLAGAQPEILAAESADRTRLLAAIDRAAATDAPGDLDGTLRMAVALARSRANGRVMVYSDGAFPRPRIDAEGVQVVYAPVGGGADNRAIVAIDARPEPQNRRRYQAFVRVQNYAPHPVAATVSLRAESATGQGTLVDSQTLRLEPEGSAAAVFADLPADASVLEARLVEPDALATDDRAWTVLERRQPLQVLLVTRGNFFLERVLALIPDLELFRVPPRRLSAIDESAYDVLVFDGAVPDIPPRKPMLIVNPQDGPFLPSRGLLRRPGSLVWNPDDPVMRYVDLRDVRVGRLVQLSPPGWMRALAESDGNPAILAGEGDGRRAVVFAFDLQSSNLPLSASFPILMSNVLGYLEPPRALDQPVVRAGAALNVAAQPQTEQVVVEGEAGVLQRAEPRRGQAALDAPGRVGVYAVQQIAGGRRLAIDPLAVNLTDPAESDPRPQTVDLPSGTPIAPSGLPGSREVWSLAVVGGAMLLVLEWWWFHRRA